MKLLKCNSIFFFIRSKICFNNKWHFKIGKNYEMQKKSFYRNTVLLFIFLRLCTAKKQCYT